MDEFKKNVGVAINAMEKIGFVKAQALEILMREVLYQFCDYFTKDVDAGGPPMKAGYYYLNTWNDPHLVLSSRLITKMKAMDPYYRIDGTAFRVADKKIMAIKYVRSLTGWGLKEAKDFVEGNSLHCTSEQAGDLFEMFNNSLTYDEFKSGQL